MSSSANRSRQHASWNGGSHRSTAAAKEKDSKVAPEQILEMLRQVTERARRSLNSPRHNGVIVEAQMGIVPCVDSKRLQSDPSMREHVYRLFYDTVGCIIVKNAFPEHTMDRVNRWTEAMLSTRARDDPNRTHAKQKDKLLVNDVMGRMAETAPDLLMQTVLSDALTVPLDALLGFARVGAATMHWIQPGGDRQQSHVDYPIHVGSGAFWEGRTSKVMEMMTRYQINKIMPYYSVQALVATDAMDASNGSTEVVPCSHLLPDMDLLVHRPEIRNALEPLFMNVRLNQGDVLLFNRRLCHRGGQNRSQARRNALIVQSVFMWGIGQEIIHHKKVVSHLGTSSKSYASLSDEEKKRIALRMKAPYPVDVKRTA